MKATWTCIWVAFAAAEYDLAAWSQSPMFLGIGAVALVMAGFNLLHQVRVGARDLAHAAA